MVALESFKWTAGTAGHNCDCSSVAVAVVILFKVALAMPFRETQKSLNLAGLMPHEYRGEAIFLFISYCVFT